MFSSRPGCDSVVPEFQHGITESDHACYGNNNDESEDQPVFCECLASLIR